MNLFAFSFPCGEGSNYALCLGDTVEEAHANLLIELGHNTETLVVTQMNLHEVVGDIYGGIAYLTTEAN